MHIRPIVVTLSLPLLFSAGLSASAPPQGSVQLRVGDGGLVSVLVAINGAGPYTFVLDTGSNRTAVSAQLARRLEQPAIATSSVLSSTGTAPGKVIRLDEIALGRVVRRNLPAVVLPADFTDLGIKADGVLGQDFLADETYTIDYGRRRLMLDVTTQSKGTRLALKRDEGRWLVALPQTAHGDQVVWFVPDSGAQALVVFDRGTRLPLLLTPLPDALVSTAAGSAMTKTALLQRLRVGQMEFTDLPAVVINRHTPDAPAGDGLLPLSVFSSVTFYGRDGYLVVGK